MAARRPGSLGRDASQSRAARAGPTPATTNPSTQVPSTNKSVFMSSSTPTWASGTARTTAPVSRSPSPITPPAPPALIPAPDGTWLPAGPPARPGPEDGRRRAPPVGHRLHNSRRADERVACHPEPLLERQGRAGKTCFPAERELTDGLVESKVG